jgi:MFS family permease
MRVALAAVWTVILTVGIVQTANGLQTDLLGLRAGLEAFPPWSIGVMMATYYVGYSAGPLLSPIVIRKLGHKLTIVVTALIAGVSIAAHGAFVSLPVWMALRLCSGLALSITYVGFESWINDRVDNRVRGRIFGTYMVTQMAAMTLAQLLLTTGDPKTMSLFILCGAIFAAGALSMAVQKLAPANAPPEPFGLMKLFRLSPLGATVTALSGVSYSIVFTFGPVYAQREGFDLTGTGVFLALGIVAGALVQFPLGWLSDIAGRRRTIVLVCVGGTLASLFGVLTEAHGAAWKDLASVLTGGFIFPLYALSVAHTNDHIAPAGRVPAAAGLILLFGFGSIFGPLMTGVAIGAFGPAAYFGVLALVMGLSVAAATVTR